MNAQRRIVLALFVISTAVFASLVAVTAATVVINDATQLLANGTLTILHPDFGIELVEGWVVMHTVYFLSLIPLGWLWWRAE